MFIDVHAHYEDEKFDTDRDEVIAKITDAGCEAIVDCAQDYETSLRISEMTEKYPRLFGAVGIHPHEALSYNNDNINKIKDIILSNKKIVAVGETGLDYHYDFAPRDVQKENFRANIELSQEVNLPLVVHDREAHEDTLMIMNEMRVEPEKAMIHCFSGSREMAEIIAKKGWYFSVGGAVTFKNARRIIEALPVIPNELLMLETDCPYMTPEPFRGRRNDSSMIPYTAAKIAEVKGIAVEELYHITNENAKRFFGLNDL